MVGGGLRGAGSASPAGLFGGGGDGLGESSSLARLSVCVFLRCAGSGVG